MRIGIVGDETSVLGFGGLGLDTYVYTAGDEPEGLWRGIPLGEYGLLFLTQEFAGALESAGVEADRDGPVVAVVPSLAGGAGEGLGRLRALVEKATGTTMITGDAGAAAGQEEL